MKRFLAKTALFLFAGLLTQGTLANTFETGNQEYTVVADYYSARVVDYLPGYDAPLAKKLLRTYSGGVGSDFISAVFFNQGSPSAEAQIACPVDANTAVGILTITTDFLDAQAYVENKYCLFSQP